MFTADRIDEKKKKVFFFLFFFSELIRFMTREINFNQIDAKNLVCSILLLE